MARQIIQRLDSFNAPDSWSDPLLVVRTFSWSHSRWLLERLGLIKRQWTVLENISFHKCCDSGAALNTRDGLIFCIGSATTAVRKLTWYSGSYPRHVLEREMDQIFKRLRMTFWERTMLAKFKLMDLPVLWSLPLRSSPGLCRFTGPTPCTRRSCHCENLPCAACLAWKRCYPWRPSGFPKPPFSGSGCQKGC